MSTNKDLSWICAQPEGVDWKEMHRKTAQELSEYIEKLERENAALHAQLKTLSIANITSTDH